LQLHLAVIANYKLTQSVAQCTNLPLPIIPLLTYEFFCSQIID